MKRHRSKKAAALITALVALFILAIMGFGVVAVSLEGVHETGHRRDMQLAYDLSEAGFEHGYESLVENANYSGDTNVTLGGGSFTTSVANGPLTSTVILTSTGKVVGGEGIVSTHSVTGMITMSSALPLLNYAIASKTSILLSGGSHTLSSPVVGVGNVYTNGSSSMSSGSSYIDGTLTAAGTASFSGGAHVTGTVTQHASPITLPTPDSASLESEAAQNGTTNGNITVPSGSSQTVKGVINGNLTVSGSGAITIDGVVFVTGNVTISGNSYSGGGTLVVQGTVTVSGTSGATAPDTSNIAFVDLSSSINAVVISGGSGVGGFIYAPVGAVTVSGGSHVFGGVASNAITLSGGSYVTRNTAQEPPPGLSTPAITYYQDQSGT